ncbi:lysine--tRNA ligase [Candidatus Daviesbacteria bacterium]|nr:lysine--tRNA ligase [Candidatus Daviesbacteria bacterium]
MEPLEGLRQVRLQKLADLKKAGISPYPAKFDKRHTIAQALASLDKKVTTAGRIMSLRPHGKITFADLRDASGQIQLFFSQENLTADSHQLLTLLDIGDFLGVSGKVFKTKAGEITIEIDNFSVLAKSLRPLPSSWYGLKDIEEKYRRRYLDLIINDDAKKTFLLRTKIVSAIRRFLDGQDFIEVETPTLQSIYGGANARPFTTHHQTLEADFYLKISDELYLKRLIVGGWEKVYEIDHNFRNEGVDRTHNPEFTMMECYQAYADYRDMMELTESLYETVAKDVLGSTKIDYQNQTIDLKKPWKRQTMAEAIGEYLGYDVNKMSDDDLKKAIAKEKVAYEGEPTLTGVAAGFVRGIAIATLFEAAEKKLVQPTFIIDFPKETAVLAKPHRDNPSLIERFEVYINGWEMGNAYSELNDPILQKAGFEEQVKAKKSGDEEAHPMDLDYVEALEYGMPPTGGLGIGIDRTVMLLSNAQNIRDVILFPTLKPEKK